MIVTPSVHRYTLAKYFEAAAAGALVVGPRPASPAMRRSLDEFVVYVELGGGGEGGGAGVLATFRWWLDHGAERQARVCPSSSANADPVGSRRDAGA